MVEKVLPRKNLLIKTQEDISLVSIFPFLKVAQKFPSISGLFLSLSLDDSRFVF